jgi:uncharacterized protein (TIGR02246 family)
MRTFCGIIVSSLFTIHCLAGPDVKAQIRKVIQDWVVAYNSRDWEAVGDVYTQDVAFMAPNGPTIFGRDAVVAEMRRYSEQLGAASVRITTMEVGGGTGSFAWDRDEAELFDANGKLIDHGKDLVVLRKEADGKWRIVCDMFSSNLPSPSLALREMQSFWLKVSEHVENRDWEGIASMYAPDIILTMPNQAPISGRENVIAAVQKGFELSGVKKLLVHVVEAGPTEGVETTWTRDEFVMLGDNDEQLDVGSCTSIYRRNEQGQWQMWRDMSMVHGVFAAQVRESML